MKAYVFYNNDLDKLDDDCQNLTGYPTFNIIEDGKVEDIEDDDTVLFESEWYDEDEDIYYSYSMSCDGILNEDVSEYKYLKVINLVPTMLKEKRG